MNFCFAVILTGVEVNSIKLLRTRTHLFSNVFSVVGLTEVDTSIIFYHPDKTQDEDMFINFLRYIISLPTGTTALLISGLLWCSRKWRHIYFSPRLENQIWRHGRCVNTLPYHTSLPTGDYCNINIWCTSVLTEVEADSIFTTTRKPIMATWALCHNSKLCYEFMGT